MNLRQIRYNIITDTAEQEILRHIWTFFILNEPREINRISERILANLTPCDDFIRIAESSIPGTNGLHYESFSVKSDRGFLADSEKIAVYDSCKFKRDRDLNPSRDDVWFDKVYLPRLIASKGKYQQHL